jgi:hypothetical protein
MLGKVDYEKVLGQVLPPPVKDVIVNMGKALDLLLASQEKLTSVLIDAVKVSEVKNVQNVRSDTIGKVKTAPQVDPHAAAEKKVKQALRDAEKKTLLFNLDLGKVPTMNKETLARKVTMALSEKVTSGDHDYDIRDAEEAVDDVLSCSKLEFLGKISKKFYNKKNPSDARNDTFCTMPVRFEFKDRETRFQAEKTLRQVCKVSCAVPYPKKLRDIMDKMVQDGKKLSPNCFIRTQVNIDNLTVEAHAKTASGWLDLGMKTQIPLTVCDTVTTTYPIALSQVSQVSQVAQTQDEVMCVS